MDGTRTRRTKDAARLRWYASWRAIRFASHMGFQSPPMSERVRNRLTKPRNRWPRGEQASA